MDLLIDTDALESAEAKLMKQSEDMLALRTNIIGNLEMLKDDWDSEAGTKFFAKFETDLLKNLEDYAKVFEYMSQNLSTASIKYEAVFSAANAVANTEL